jgi:oligoribonuclease (3'-5' exoribonuclease)
MDNLLWMDLETTGLDNRYDVILEVSAIITTRV